MDVEVGRTVLNTYGKRPKQTVRALPGKGAGPEEVPQRKDRAEGGSPKPSIASHTSRFVLILSPSVKLLVAFRNVSRFIFRKRLF